jgi:hypothetical protein
MSFVSSHQSSTCAIAAQVTDVPAVDNWRPDEQTHDATPPRGVRGGMPTQCAVDRVHLPPQTIACQASSLGGVSLVRSTG